MLSTNLESKTDGYTSALSTISKVIKAPKIVKFDFSGRGVVDASQDIHVLVGRLLFNHTECSNCGRKTFSQSWETVSKDDKNTRYSHLLCYLCKNHFVSQHSLEEVDGVSQFKLKSTTVCSLCKPRTEDSKWNLCPSYVAARDNAAILRNQSEST